MPSRVLESSRHDEAGGESSAKSGGKIASYADSQETSHEEAIRSFLHVHQEQVRKRGLPPLIREFSAQRGKPLFPTCSLLI